MESQCLRLKLQKGKTDTFLNWVKSLHVRGDELKTVLQNAGINCEMLFLERNPDADYLILYTRAESLSKSNFTLLTSNLTIDKETREIFKSTCEFDITPLEPLIEVSL